MNTVPLAEFVVLHGQGEAAKALGTTQAAISKAVKTGRYIYVQKKTGGGFEAVELKGFPSGGCLDRGRPDLENIVSMIAPIAQHPGGSVQTSSSSQVSR